MVPASRRFIAASSQFLARPAYRRWHFFSGWSLAPLSPPEGFMMLPNNFRK
jgi:hypothetical protein